MGPKTERERTMTEAAGGGRAEIERRLIQRSLQDEDYRRRLLADPKAALEEELGTPLPEAVRIVAVEETADTIYLVLPAPLRSTTKVASSPTWSWRRWPERAKPGSVSHAAHATRARGAARAPVLYLRHAEVIQE
jgi:hypothetical protein